MPLRCEQFLLICLWFISCHYFNHFTIVSVKVLRNVLIGNSFTQEIQNVLTIQSVV